MDFAYSCWPDTAPQEHGGGNSETTATNSAVASESRLIGTICSGVFIPQIMISVDARHFVRALFRRGAER